MSAKLDQFSALLKLALGDKITKLVFALDELTIECKADDYIAICTKLRDHAELKFEQLIDLCGVDYSEYALDAMDAEDNQREGARYAAVLHLLSISLNQRVRLKVFAQDDNFPVLPTSIANMTTANAALQTAINNAIGRDRSKLAILRQAKAVVAEILRGTALYVNTVVTDGDEVKLLSSGLDLTKIPEVQGPPSIVVNLKAIFTNASGTIPS